MKTSEFVEQWFEDSDKRCLNCKELLKSTGCYGVNVLEEKVLTQKRDKECIKDMLLSDIQDAERRGDL